jgi:hypothetical protein
VSVLILHQEVFRLFGKPHRRGGGGVDMVINFLEDREVIGKVIVAP